MPCSICNHTVQNLGVADRRVFWCSRCGTVKTVDDDHENVSVPWLVDRVKAAHLASDKTSLDGQTLSYTVPVGSWVTTLEAIGVKL